MLRDPMILCPIQSPVRITQSFKGDAKRYAKYGIKGHSGTDITGPRPGELVPVVAPFDGEVYEVGDQGDAGYGKFLRIRSAPDRKGVRKECVLGHLSVISHKAGDEVRMGDAVGVMGNTGDSTAPHLHFGLRRIDRNGEVMNAGNGYSGYEDCEKYLVFWRRDGMASYPNG